MSLRLTALLFSFALTPALHADKNVTADELLQKRAKSLKRSKHSHLWTRYLLTVTLAGFVVLTGCTKTRARINPLDPSSGMTTTPTPVPGVLQVLWKNNTLGTFSGNALAIAATAAPGTAAYSVVAVTDDVTLDTSTLRLTAVTSTNLVQLEINTSPSVSVNTSGYNSGYIRFNIRLEKPIASFTSVTCWNATLNLASLSTSVFTHVDIPVSSYCGCSSLSTPFFVRGNMTSNTTGAIFTVNDIRWTPN